MTEQALEIASSRQSIFVGESRAIVPIACE